MDKKNNPHYQNGYFSARNMIRFIHNTTYGTLENAIFRKKELMEDLKENFGWDETNKDIAELMGMIDALEEAFKQQKAEARGHQISLEDIDDVAKSINKSITIDQAEKILDNFSEAAENDPGATWNLIVENLIYEITE